MTPICLNGCIDWEGCPSAKGQQNIVYNWSAGEITAAAPAPAIQGFIRASLVPQVPLDCITMFKKKETWKMEEWIETQRPSREYRVNRALSFTLPSNEHSDCVHTKVPAHTALHTRQRVTVPSERKSMFPASGASRNVSKCKSNQFQSTLQRG